MPSCAERRQHSSPSVLRATSAVLLSWRGSKLPRTGRTVFFFGRPPPHRRLMGAARLGRGFTASFRFSPADRRTSAGKYSRPAPVGRREAGSRNPLRTAQHALMLCREGKRRYGGTVRSRARMGRPPPRRARTFPALIRRSGATTNTYKRARSGALGAVRASSARGSDGL